MEALAHGTLMYGQILPGGVNQFAFGRGFRDIVYTNQADAKYVSFGSSKLRRGQARGAQRCTAAIAAKVRDSSHTATTPYAAPQFAPLSWASARPGVKLYDGSYRHVATIVTVNRASGIIHVKFASNGAVEPKDLESVARFWYVPK